MGGVGARGSLRFARVALTALIVLASYGCADDDGGPANPEDGVVLRGEVRDASTGSPIKDAKVIFRSDAHDEADDRTDREGRFVMTVFSRSDTGRIEARKGGYDTAVVSVYLDDADVRIDVDLERQ